MLSINSRMPYSVIPSKPPSEHARKRRCKALSSWRIPAHILWNKNIAIVHRNRLPARERFVNLNALSINWGVADLCNVSRRLMLSIYSRMPYSVIPSKPPSEHARRRRCKALSSRRIPAHILWNKNIANAHRNGLPARERFVNKLGRREPVQGVATPLLRSSFADIRHSGMCEPRRMSRLHGGMRWGYTVTPVLNMARSDLSNASERVWRVPDATFSTSSSRSSASLSRLMPSSIRPALKSI